MFPQLFLNKISQYLKSSPFIDIYKEYYLGLILFKQNVFDKYISKSYGLSNYKIYLIIEKNKLY